jgi:hypothetical protein
MQRLSKKMERKSPSVWPLDEKTPLIEWTSQLENSAKAIGEKATGYKIMHVNAARKANQTYDILMYLGILCGPISGLLSAISAIVNPEADTVLPIFSTVVSVISSIFIAAVKFGKFEEESSAHKLAAARYTSLESNVRRQLLIGRPGRIHVDQYINYIGSSYDELFMASPLIPETIYKKYAALAAKRGMVVPDEYGLTVMIDPVLEQQIINEVVQQTAIQVNVSDVDMRESKRSIESVPVPELTRYSDGQMNYELKRMMGFK